MVSLPAHFQRQVSRRLRQHLIYDRHCAVVFSFRFRSSTKDDTVEIDASLSGGSIRGSTDREELWQTCPRFPPAPILKQSVAIDQKAVTATPAQVDEEEEATRHVPGRQSGPVDAHDGSSETNPSGCSMSDRIEDHLPLTSLSEIDAERGLTSLSEVDADSGELVLLGPKPAGPLYDANDSSAFIPQYDVSLTRRKRILVLCTGGTMTMAPNPDVGGGLSPVHGMLSKWVTYDCEELRQPHMPEVVVHEYSPLLDSSDLGPQDWVRLAGDIASNYVHFDGFVIVMGTDTMAFAASALSFMLENLGKPVILTGSQIPLAEPQTDARRNFIMAIIFATRDTICEVAIFFHDRLVRGCRATKVNTHQLMGFDSPNAHPLARVGIAIEENQHMFLPQARGALRVHRKMDTRLLVVRLVPGFDDMVLRNALLDGTENMLRALVLQLYGTGNLPSAKKSLVDTLTEVTNRGILVVATTQCPTGSVVLGKYAVGHALRDAGVVSAGDMTVEATSAKLSYLFGRGDLDTRQVGELLRVSLRGEVSPPPRELDEDMPRKKLHFGATLPVGLEGRDHVALPKASGGLIAAQV